ALAVWWMASRLNLLQLGDEEAHYLGVNVQALQRWLLLCSAVLVAVAVAISGVIGFIGLVVPHLMRLWLGPDHRGLIPGSLLAGAILLLLADTLARTVAAPAEIPVGLLTSLLGAPWFLWLVFHRENSRHGWALAVWWMASRLNLLQLGDEEAHYLGVNVQALQRWLLLCSAVLVAVAVAISGVIGFIGLVVPHLMRLWLGPDHRGLIPGSLLAGAILLLLADTLARTVAAPAEIPVGLLTSLLGAPWFLWLVFRRENSRHG
ncbi:FecCD family ABC transporter permease, partial [Klebsiella pneumoniae]|uniref:FecCD family ABC transporter permease n=1 Tax=Klebsiella pneumoniae TaxID=573 RepID=UPI003F7F2CD0